MLYSINYKFSVKNGAIFKYIPFYDVRVDVIFSLQRRHDNINYI